jgi:hypothetical protein
MGLVAEVVGATAHECCVRAGRPRCCFESATRTRELLCDAAESIRRLSPQRSAPPDDPRLPGPREPLRVLGCAINGIAAELAFGMLVQLVDDLPIAVDITGTRMQASELVSLVQAREFPAVCFADLPPSPPSKTRYLVKRLRAALSEVRILVGRWAPPALADESTQLLRESGANHVGSTLVETGDYVGGLVDISRIPVPGTIGRTQQPRHCHVDVVSGRPVQGIAVRPPL